MSPQPRDMAGAHPSCTGEQIEHPLSVSPTAPGDFCSLPAKAFPRLWFCPFPESRRVFPSLHVSLPAMAPSMMCLVAPSVASKSPEVPWERSSSTLHQVTSLEPWLGTATVECVPIQHWLFLQVQLRVDSPSPAPQDHCGSLFLGHIDLPMPRKAPGSAGSSLCLPSVASG